MTTTIVNSTELNIDDLVDDSEVNNPMTLQPHRTMRRLALANKPESVVDGIFSRGELVVLAGESGTGKTWLTLDMATAVATGQQWLGRDTERCNVAYLDGESGEYLWHNRHVMVENGRNLAGTNHWDILLDHFPEIDLLTEPLHLIDLITANSVDLMFIDALSAVHSGNENDTKDMTRVMQALLKASRQTQCAIVLIHHTAKGGGYRGSSVIKNKCDVLLELTAQSDGKIKLASEKMRTAAPVTIYGQHEWDDGRYTLTIADRMVNTPTKPPSKRDTVIQVICEYLRKSGIVKHGDIVNACMEQHGYQMGTVKNAIHHAIKTGVIFRESGNYFIKAGAIVKS